MLLVATGDYNTGSIHKSFRKQLSGDLQYTAANRRKVIIKTSVCSESVRMSFAPELNKDPHPVVAKGRDALVFWSEGNHPVTLDYNTRHGVNNAAAYINKFTNTYQICNMTNPFRNLFYISLHRRAIAGKRTAESLAVIDAFSRNMSTFFLSGGCGRNTRYIDVYNMSTGVPKNESYDGMHFGRSVNLIKAHIILNAVHADSFSLSDSARERQNVVM